MMMSSELPTVICLMGPTAAGKTDVAIELIQHLPCDIISVDSAMVYCDMNIGTAKPSAQELALAPHKLIDIRDPAQSYSAAEFYQDALHEIKVSIAQQRIPLLVGGTMLYFNALQNGLSPLPEANQVVRQQLEQQAQAVGWAAMHARLQKIDVQAAERIHANDPQRIQRALEVYELTGKTLSELQGQKPQPLNYRFLNVALAPSDRSILHQRIEQRFDYMLQNGFIDEVETLYHREDLHIDLPAMRAVGYRQMWHYLTGTIDKQQMREQGIAATRQLAKRQLTWLRRWPELCWLEFDQNNAVQQILTHF
jgi:tRNA dimethylallyltransferase